MSGTGGWYTGMCTVNLNFPHQWQKLWLPVQMQSESFFIHLRDPAFIPRQPIFLRGELPECFGQTADQRRQAVSGR